MRYKPSLFESKWQDKWEKSGIFSTPKDLLELQKKPKYYALDMFPYPSGAGLHVGHPEGYTATDIVARFKKMNGFNVLHCMGWDAFGLPAERAAMREGIHPSVITKRNIDNFRCQIKRLGFFYDWSKEISTTDEKYYKWTQWIFLKLYNKGLAYLADVNVNWCPALKTVLANEEVKDGKYVETQDIVEKRSMRQWMLKITVYAERLLNDLDELDWPESVKEMQRNWIGKSEGANVNFTIEGNGKQIEIFTTRPETIFGVSFIALAPEYNDINSLIKVEYLDECLKYIEQAKEKEENSRQNKQKTGVFTGNYAIHPFLGTKLPIYIADYILPHYGTGAIMGVPSEDERDKEFAIIKNIKILQIFSEDKLCNSDFLDGLCKDVAIQKAIKEIEIRNIGKKCITYKLRDWLFSRQRYWGEPFPIAYNSKNEPFALSESDLPIILPEIDEYKPTEDGQPPLARANEKWRKVLLPNGEEGLREVNTMPQWAGSCWYYLRYLDPENEQSIFDTNLERYWMPVDLYIGGVEHAVLHLLYARFWHKVLYDLGLVHTKEPFQKLFNQGMILAQSYQDSFGKYYHPSEVYEKNNQYFSKEKDLPLNTQIEKMSKSRLNVVNPDEVIEQYGADAMRLYELFMGPLEQVKPWQMTGVEGVYRFLSRVWRLVIEEDSGNISSKISEDQSDEELQKLLHFTIKKVTEDIESLKFNTAIAQMMTFVNIATQKNIINRSDLIDFLKILSPFAPHICDELSERLSYKEMLLNSKWPKYRNDLLKDEYVDITVQIDGKKRGNINIPKNAKNEDIENIVFSSEDFKRFLQDRAIKKVIIVPQRIVNIVTGNKNE